MKKFIAFSLLLPLLTANAADSKVEKKNIKKNKAAQAKIYRHHESNWHQPDYGYEVVLYQCHDSWGQKLRGRFSNEQQYFIELGGGSCRKLQKPRRDHASLYQISRHDFPIDDVYQAIRRIKREYGLRRANLVEASNVDAGFKTFRYTLTFNVKGQGYREFRIKHNRWNGNIRAIYEV